ncbi:PREDICTED: uncharacterized protein LOC109589012, partial [Amphimedon queenslandica]|uniref:C2H2-type domain-containing protein n=1 Tax=Amphimedon queenslandica TaxID=400682 RepID=A0AAN0JUW1_AMPQE
MASYSWPAPCVEVLTVIARVDNRSGLSRHKNTCIGTKSSEISDITAAANVGNINCHFTGCDTRFVCSDDLIKHFSDVRNEKVNIDKKMFATMEEFTTWKADFEARTSSNFVLHCAPKKRLHYLCYYYYCNCSGSFNSRSKGKRS